MILRSPSTSWVSLAKACMLSLVRALAKFALAFACCFLVAAACSCSNSASTSIWAYQISRLRIPAACFIRVR